MKAPILFEEVPPTFLGSIVGLGLGLIYVVIKYGLYNQLSNAAFIVMASLGVVIICFWAMRRRLGFWLAALSISVIYYYLASSKLFIIRGDMGYELYPQIVTLSLIQISAMYTVGIIIRRRQSDR